MSRRTSHLPYIVGLTGGIACGKSSISGLFEKLGVPIVDADIVAREVVKKGSPLLDTIASRFGSEVITENGDLNRALLRKIAFDKDHPDNLKDLNSIMQPAIRKRILEDINSHDSLYVIAVIPLLFEHKLETLADRVLVVDIQEDLQLERLIKRDNISKELALNIMANQVDRQTRLKNADDLIESDNSPLDKKLNVVVKLHNLYQRLAKEKTKTI
ncbi:MAG: dephospho-CoA kinase [Aeromonadales bacterium]|nr:dephospho-CoA kinase [Aeromonadales bacterium]